MVKSQIGLGVLSLPAVFDTFGMIPGVIILLTVGIITTWSDDIVGVFKLRHREIYSVADAGGVMFGPIGNESMALLTSFVSLGSAGPTVNRVAYGLVLPGILASAILPIHLPAKQVFVHPLRGSKHLTSNTPIHWTTWWRKTDLGLDRQIERVCPGGIAAISWI
ncbi:unnamed protein product [Clonostachys rhizophaga]|uniref:Amino acid transporter transmembrane domain-containing protein n=1 Tax=Clonostachys rhizophaga TaxID=160324 RepID=A0A9N9VVU7_9HYPO|nr:unnamed protein product [Clonostachys rhizophaga]